MLFIMNLDEKLQKELLAFFVVMNENEKRKEKQMRFLKNEMKIETNSESKTM